MLYAQNRWSLLLVFQAMDAPAKTARSITSCLASIRRDASVLVQQPSSEEIAQTSCGAMPDACPSAAAFIFNRSYYEEVLVVRVHPELLERQKLPQPLVSKRIWTSGSPTSRISRTTPPDRARKF
jgi:polyphosphate kinase 2 (PPK2 family)